MHCRIEGVPGQGGATAPPPARRIPGVRPGGRSRARRPARREGRFWSLLVCPVDAGPVGVPYSRDRFALRINEKSVVASVSGCFAVPQSERPCASRVCLACVWSPTRSWESPRSRWRDVNRRNELRFYHSLPKGFKTAEKSTIKLDEVAPRRPVRCSRPHYRQLECRTRELLRATSKGNENRLWHILHHSASKV